MPMDGASQKRCERYWLNDWIEEPPAENKRKALLTAALWLNQPPGQRLEQLDIFCDIVRGKFIPHNHCRDQQLLSLLLEVIDSGEPLGRHLAPLLDEYANSMEFPQTPTQEQAEARIAMFTLLHLAKTQIVELDSNHTGSKKWNEVLDELINSAGRA